MVRRAFIVLPVLVAALAGVARADDVVLNSGRTLTGRIVKETDTQIVFEWRGGKLTLQRSDIKEIKKNSPPPAPAPTPAPTGNPPGKGVPPKSPPTKPDVVKPGSARDVRNLLGTLEAIVLSTWEQEDAKGVTEATDANYKIIAPDGSESSGKDRPASPDGIAALYVRQANRAGDHVFLKDGAIEYVWQRLYWHEERKEWLVISPQLESFQKDSALATRIADLCCTDENGRVAGWISQQSLAYARQAKDDQGVEMEKKKLLEDGKLATGSDKAGAMLAKIHEMNVDIEFAKPADKVRMAGERRKALHDLVDAVGK